MGLLNYAPARTEIPLGAGNSMKVRGINTQDVQILVHGYKAELIELVGLYSAIGDDVFGNSNLQNAVFAMVTNMPNLVADIIVLTSDEPGSYEQARTLPFPVSVDAMSTIIDLTFRDTGGPGNFLATLQSILLRLLPAAVAVKMEASLNQLKIAWASSSLVSAET